MIGYFFITCYCIFSAFSFVFISLGNQYDKSVIAFSSFLIATSFFNISNFYHLRATYRKIGVNIKDVLGINFVSACGWLASLHALNYISPATLLCTNMGVTSIFSFLITTKISEYRKNYPIIIAILCILVGLGTITYQEYQTQKNMQSFYYVLTGGILAIIDGISGAYVGFFAERLTKNRFSVLEILSSRFFLLIIVSWVLLLLLQDSLSFTSITISDFQYLTFVSFILIIIPLFLYVKSIAHLGALSTGIMLSLIPIFAYFMQLYTSKYHFSPIVFFVLIFCSASIISMNLLHDLSTKDL